MLRSLTVPLVVCFLAAPAAAQPFETAGARALGMGGAFTAVADDVTAIWWNPAGLASGGFFGAAIEAHRFDDDRSSFFLGVGSLPLGLSYTRTSETLEVPGPLDQPYIRQLKTHQAGITLLHSLTDTIVVSTTLKFVRGSAVYAPSESETDGNSSHAFDADIAVMAHAGDIKAGLTIRNAASPAFETQDGGRLEIPWRARAGVSYFVTPALTVALDVDLRAIQEGPDKRRSLAIGGEWRSPRFAIRSGARFDTFGDVNPLGTVGGSYAVRNGMWVDVWAAGGSRVTGRGWGLAGRIIY